MMFERSCKFYENSRCILEGRYCDLDCNRLFSEGDLQFSKHTDTLARWQMEEVEREIAIRRRKLK